MAPGNISRRDFLRYTGALGIGGFLPMGGYDIALRPPGAVRDFLARCIRCGSCIEACPYDSIRAMGITSGALGHTPYVDPLKTPCYLCQERGPDGKDRPLSKYLRCGDVCPTGALKKIVNDKDVLAEVPHELKMGTSVLNRKLCLAWQYDSCGECYYNCPLKDKALLDRPPGFEELSTAQTIAPGAVGAISGPGRMGATGIRPYVDPDHCI
ncbi:MAG: 4Fe-4S dicluster domain-containing protein, partial [Anaerolineae bacterium]|nr:4Fe-4S dicluster domain-containing protein [Anaerolineae bacterium]